MTALMIVIKKITDSFRIFYYWRNESSLHLCSCSEWFPTPVWEKEGNTSLYAKTPLVDPVFFHTKTHLPFSELERSRCFCHVSP
jgi:hypothetical protein